VNISSFSAALFIVFALLFVLDGYWVLRQRGVRIERECSRSIAVDRWGDVTLTIHHDAQTLGRITVFDGLSGQVDYEGLPASVRLQPGKSTALRYRLKVNERGPFQISPCYVKAPSILGLWDVQYRASDETQVKVYPDFSAITAYTILATDNHVSQIGIKRKPRRGEGLEFLQLRDYRDGDSLRQIDWNATSRRNKLISKEYQDERDQQIVLVVDSGRRMRAKDDTLSHFDHSLNAMLLVSYIALRQGDSVSVMSFGNTHRWVAPQKGVGAMKTILNEMYDLQAGNCAPDYVAAAEQLTVLQRKRSLVVLVTNSRDEEVDELMMAAQLLSRRHIVLLANIREKVIDDLEKKEIHQLDDALRYSGLHNYLKRRQDVHQKIVGSGIFAVDCLASQLASRVANSYLEIKRAGVL